MSLSLSRSLLDVLLLMMMTMMSVVMMLTIVFVIKVGDIVLHLFSGTPHNFVYRSSQHQYKFLLSRVIGNFRQSVTLI